MSRTAAQSKTHTQVWLSQAWTLLHLLAAPTSTEERGRGVAHSSVFRRTGRCAGDLRESWGREGPREEGVGIHSSILAWRIPWTEEPGGLQSMGSQRVGRNLSDLAHTMLNRTGMKTRARDWALLTRARQLAALPCPHTYKAQTRFSFFAAQSNRVPNRTPDNPLSGSEETQCSGCNKTFKGGRDGRLDGRLEAGTKQNHDTEEEFEKHFQNAKEKEKENMEARSQGGWWSCIGSAQSLSHV